MLNKLRGSLVFILGYMLSPLSWWNVAGFLLMQFGATDFLSQSKRNFKKELLIALISSTVYTVVILLMMQFDILENPLSSHQ